MKGNLKCLHFDKNIDNNLISFCNELEKHKVNNKTFIQLFGELYITSGGRCNECNKNVGGTEISTHKLGKAFDIKCESSILRYTLLKYILLNGKKYNITRIGIGKNFIHIDTATTKDNYPVEIVFLY